MGRHRAYKSDRKGAPLLSLRLHPDVHAWISEVKGRGWVREFLEAAYTRETGREVPFPNRYRRARRERDPMITDQVQEVEE